MKLALRLSFWIEAALAVATGILALISIFWQDWIEALTGFDPDAHDGSIEWLVVIVLAIVCVVFSVAARSEWRRATSGLGTARP